MQKKLLTLGLILIIPVVLTGCTIKDKLSKLSDNAKEKVENVKEDAEDVFSGNIKDLMGKGKNLKCTFKNSDEHYSYEGTVYVAGDKVRTDSTSTLEGETTEAYTIMDKEWMYTWNSTSNQGFKMNIQDITDMAEDIKDSYEDVDLDETDKFNMNDLKEQFDYKCTPWIPDNSKFDVPSNIEFIDQSEMLKQMESTMESFKENAKDMCGVCESMSDEAAKQECRDNLGC